MVTRLQVAQELFGYDPDMSEWLIQIAEKDLAWMIEYCDHLQSQINTLEDDAVYEFECDEGFVQKQHIAETTAKTIVVASPSRDERKELPRQPLEAGAVVSYGSGWSESEYALGSTLRPMLVDLLNDAEFRVEDWRRDLQHLRSQMAAGDLVLRPDELAMIDDHLAATAAQEESICWQKEGF